MKEIFENLNKDILWLKEKTIFLTISGSISYGLNTETSDIDYRGITTIPKEYLFGFNKSFDQFILKEPDTQIFNIRKFFDLAKSGNPNMFDFLFAGEKFHKIKTPLGKILIDNRDKFLSRNIKERYIGYAKSQFYRAANHKRWVDKKMQPPPTREEFGLPHKLIIPKDQLLTIQALMNKKIDQWNCDFEPFSDAQKIYLQNKVSSVLSEMNILSDNKWMLAARSLGLNENFILALQKEKAYQNIVDDYTNYKEWIKNRNPKRAELEAKVGYDAKHLMQCIRISKLGKEILLTGKVQIERVDDRDELLSIKNCQWKYEELVEYYNRIEKEMEEAYFKSPLPPQPDIQFLDNLCIELVQRSLAGEW
jgi:uncharacterized protein